MVNNLSHFLTLNFFAFFKRFFKSFNLFSTIISSFLVIGKHSCLELFYATPKQGMTCVSSLEFWHKKSIWYVIVWKKSTYLKKRFRVCVCQCQWLHHAKKNQGRLISLVITENSWWNRMCCLWISCSCFWMAVGRGADYGKSGCESCEFVTILFFCYSHEQLWLTCFILDDYIQINML